MSDTASSTLTLYGDCVSGNCLKVRWVAEQLGVEHDWVDVDLRAGGARTEEFLAINPLGKAPVARWSDGRILPESNAIMLHLAEISPDGSRFLPADPFQRAQMMSWLFWEQYSHEPYIAVRRSHKVNQRDIPEDEDARLAAKGRRALGVMEMQLTHTEWLVGDAITLADIALVAYTRWAHEGGFDVSEFPGVERWVRRVEAALGLEHAHEAA